MHPRTTDSCFISKMGLPTKQPCGISRARPSRQRPERLMAAGSNARQRPGKDFGQPWHRPFTRKAGLYCSRQRSQFFAGSDQGRITSVFKAIKSARVGSVPFKRRGLAGLPTSIFRDRCPMDSDTLELGWHDGVPVGLPGSSSGRAYKIRRLIQHRKRSLSEA